MDNDSDELSPEEVAAFRAAALEASASVDAQRRDMAVRDRADEERRNRLVLAIDGVRTYPDLCLALEQLAARVRNVQTFERQPRHGEARPSELTQTEDVLRVLLLSLAIPDEKPLQELHAVAERHLKSGLGGYRAQALQSGAASRAKEDFTAEIVRLVASLDRNAPRETIARAVAGELVWRDCPYPRLRGMVPGHRLLEPRIEEWFATHWARRDPERPNYAELARLLLLTLGIEDAAAFPFAGGGADA